MLALVWLPGKVVAQSITVSGSLTTFYANDGTTSPVQSYTVSVTGLTADLVITPPAGKHFEVSKDNIMWASTNLTFTPSEVNGLSKTIYIRYSPPSGVAEPSHSGSISHTSTGAETQNLSVIGVNKPTIRLTGTFTKVVNQLTNTASAGQAISIEGNILKGDIVVSAPSYFQVSKTDVDTDYTNSISFTPISGSVNSTFYIRYNPINGLGSHLGDISAASTDATTQFIQVEGNAIAVEPTVQAEVAVAASDEKSISLSFSGGNGERRLVVAKEGSAVNANPLDGSSYTANSTFGSGNVTGANNFVVYNSTGGSVTVSGLKSNTEYFFAVYEFNNGGFANAENYLTPAATISAFTQIEALPITLLTFTATLSPEKQVLVNWATVSEINNHRFEVERSEDGIFFQKLGTLKGAGTASERRDYRMVDSSPLSGTSYYRLRQVDFDGTTAYSQMVAVRNNNRFSRTATLYPNPVLNTVKIDLGFAAKGAKVMVMDMLGRMVMNEPAPTMLSEETLSLDMSRLNAGTYQLTIFTEEGQISRKFIKADR